MFHALFLCDKKTMDIKLDRNRFASAKAIGEYLRQRRGRLIWSGPNWPGWNVERSVSENIQTLFPLVHTFEFALLYNMQDVPGIDELPTERIISCNELFRSSEIEKHMRAKPHFLILHHTNEKNKLSVPWRHIHHCADPNTFKPRSGDRPIDVLLVGNLSTNTYPLRVKLKAVIGQLKKMGLKAEIHKHPGYETGTPEEKVRDFVRSMQQSKIVVSCSSKYRYRLSKFAEIPMCGCALATDIPLDGAEFFRQFVIELLPGDEVMQIVHKLVKALRSWKVYAAQGYELTMSTSLQEHYAKRFLRSYEKLTNRRIAVVKDGGALGIDSATVSNHCLWIPDYKWGEHLGLKVPARQHNGMLTKNIQPPQADYSMASIAMEYTFMRWLAERGYAPPVGDVVRFDNGMFGYEIADATTMAPGPVKDHDHAHRILAEAPITGSPGCLEDLALNVLNGYFIDGRRSPQDMYRWTDPQSLWRIPGINMLERRVLMVVDVEGWAWDYKARSIRDNFRGAAKIDLVYQGAYSSKILKNYDHVHFFSWRHIDPEAVQMARYGLIDVSTTIASAENELNLETCKKRVEGVRIVAVSPFLTKRSKHLFPNCGGVFPAYNGVEETIFVPRPPTPKREGPIRVLLCNKPNAKGYDAHGLWIAQKVKEFCPPNALVTLHLAKHNSENKLDRSAMIKLYQEHDLFVHTGRHHLGTPNMAFEAAACGLAIVSTANGCLPEFFSGTSECMGALVECPVYRPKDDTVGRLIAEANVRDRKTAEAIVSAIAGFTREDVEEMGRAARREVVAKWRWSQRAQDYGPVFDA